MNQDIINEIKNNDYASITETIEKFLSEQIEKNHAKGIILGLSGGIDSAVLAYICKRKLKEKTLAIIMPDTSITPTETEDALKMISLTGIKHKLIDIKPIVNEYSMYLEPNEKSKGNLRARVRTNILYYYANSKNYLVLGSSDKSEYLIGYFTKFGDGASDLTPIISLYKLQVREIAKYLGVPDNIISKKNPDLPSTATITSPRRSLPLGSVFAFLNQPGARLATRTPSERSLKLTPAQSQDA